MKVAAALLAGLVLAVSAAAASGRAHTGSAPVLGIDFEHRTLGWFDAATLDRLPGRQVALGDNAGGWAFSPNRSLLATSSYNGGTIRIVDARSMRVLRDVLVRGSSNLDRLAWTSVRTLLAVDEHDTTADVLVLDTRHGRTLRRVPLGRNVWSVGRLPDGAAYMLLASKGYVPVRVAVAAADGSIRSVTVPEITGGTISAEGTNEPSVARRVPGFAVDPTGRRAFVVGTDLRVAEIDLRTLAVTMHALGGSRALAKSLNGPQRYAVWLGHDTLAVGGDDWTTVGKGVKQTTTATPIGVRLVDTARWTQRVLDPDAAYFQIAGDTLLTSRESFDGGPQTFVAYALDGRERYRLTLPMDVWPYASGGYLYLCGGTSTTTLRTVLDATSGSVLAEHGAASTHACPNLLRDSASGW